MPCKAAAASVSWIDSDRALAEAVAGWGRVIGIDTEFQRTDTFFPLPGLYQVSDGEEIFLVDPLEIADFSPLLEILEDRRMTKIMHACSEDLELLRHHFGAVPVGLFDTQLANAFLTPHYSVSFTRLVEERLGIELVQHETRSDWLARPLSDEQVRYATEDVLYLPPLHAGLHEALLERGRFDWFREEMDRRGRFELGDPERYYLSMKKAWRLPGPVRARLQALAAWRERQAMAEDRPRSRIVRDEHLLHLAELERVAADEVRDVLPRGVARRYEDDLLDAHARGSETTEHPPAAEVPLDAAANAVVRDLRDLARARAEALGMAPELLARKREVEACVREFAATGELSEPYLGWRDELVGEAFREILGRAR
ncbi:MAG: HRDC domain-containing protein [Pseudomonadales bacterium]